MTRPVPSLTFRVYPESTHGRYFEVKVFESVREFVTYARRIGRRTSNNARGMWVNWRTTTRDQRWKGGKFVGEILFVRSYLQKRGVTVISHEAAHAVLAWVDRMGLSAGLVAVQPAVQNTRGTMMASDGPEERFCYAMGVTCRQIVQKCYDTGIFV